MTATRFLEYEIVLLLAKYGKDPVLSVLATKLNCLPTDLEALLAEIDKQKAGPRRPRKAPADPLEAIVSQYPQKASQLRLLHARFQNRTFLAEFRDIRRFFDQHSHSLGRIKSRAQSLPGLLALLAELDVDELDTLCQARESGGYSSLGIISDEILRRDR